MAHRLFFVLFIIAVLLGLGLMVVVLLRHFNKVWWERKWVRSSAWALPILGISSFTVFASMPDPHHSTLAFATMATAMIVATCELSLVVALPISGLFHLADSLIHRWKSRKTAEQDQPHEGRRRFLKRTAVAVPLLTLTTDAYGIGRAFGDVNVTVKRFKYAGLPAALDGLRILHLSDLHLSVYVNLTDLEQILTDAAKHSPDLILVTGDIADDLRLLPDAIRMLDSARAPLGAYASLGNHEHFRGVQQVVHAFSGSPVLLLVDEGRRIEIGDSTLYLAGIDDPVTMRDIREDYFVNSIGKALVDRDSEAFTILMSHRPNAFDEAETHGIDLTLAGHTHGAQLGLGGRSLLESSFPTSYLWGHYRKNAAQLYTSSGAGHWFPFRLGCPTEAPVIELNRE